MDSAATLPPPDAPRELPWSEPDWISLLRRVEDEKVGVIPVLGPDLVQCGTGEAAEPLTRHVARELARRLGLPPEIAAGAAPLDGVAAAHAQRGGPRIRFTEELCDLLANLALPTPEPLRQLAEIGHFGIFITTAHDPLLERALTEARGVAPETLAYAPRKFDDLPGTLRRVRERGRPVIYQLLGERSNNADFWAVTEEDRLEFYHSLQAPNRQPELLFSELKDRHLLLVGSGYPDWLARFFLRTIKGQRLSVGRSVEELIADPAVLADAQLRTFLARYSPQTRLHPTGDPAAFIAELHRRYLERHPRAQSTTAALPAGYAPPPEQPPAHAVFLSYAREDLAAVQRLYTELKAAGIPAWFDMERLEGGDAFKKKIFEAIDAARLFVPVVSRSVGNRPRFVHAEWNYAVERLRFFPKNVPFAVPVFIDDLPEAESPVPDRFLEVHIERLPGGATTPAFIEAMKRKLVSS